MKGKFATSLQWDKAQNCRGQELQRMLKKTLFQSLLQQFGQQTYLKTEQGEKGMIVIQQNSQNLRHEERIPTFRYNNVDSKTDSSHQESSNYCGSSANPIQEVVN